MYKILIILFLFATNANAFELKKGTEGSLYVSSVYAENCLVKTGNFTNETKAAFERAELKILEVKTDQIFLWLHVNCMNIYNDEADFYQLVATIEIQFHKFDPVTREPTSIYIFDYGADLMPVFTGEQLLKNYVNLLDRALVIYKRKIND